MDLRCLPRLSVCVLACGLIASPCFATDYNEAISGDFSGSGLTPTLVGNLTAGSNTILGTTGRGTSGLDRDYLTVTVPSGFQLVSLTQLPGTLSGGVSFMGVQTGSQVTVPTNTPNASGLLGWMHYGPANVGSNILPILGTPSNGSTGFTGALGPGNYSFWIQDFNTGTFPYGFNFGVQAVPEPGSLALIAGAGLGSGLFVFSRRAYRRKNA